MTERRDRRSRLLTIGVGAAVAVAFADSSIVVLALPALYSSLHTSVVGVSWVITSYNLVVAVAAFALLAGIGRIGVAILTRAGMALFAAGSIGCALSGGIGILIAFRCVQGAGAAMLLAGALELLCTLTGSRSRGLAVWIAAGTFGAAVGPALGGILTQAFDWPAIFVFQAPVALVGLIAAFESHAQIATAAAPLPEPADARSNRAAANVALGLVFGALVGALFLAVLLVITGWGLSPIAGAAVVSALPLAAVAARRLAAELSIRTATAAGSLLVTAGLVALALLPAVSAAIVAVALALCGAGMGLAVPALTGVAVVPDARLTRHGSVTIGARHAGLVLALVLVAPLLSHDLEQGSQDALLSGTKVLLNADVPIRQQVPIAVDLGHVVQHTPRGVVPDLAQPFNKRGAAHDAVLRHARDSLVGAIKDAITRSFRPSMLLCAALAALALIPIALLRRRRVP
jgi:predicted MFS family arabinose efflux permease